MHLGPHAESERTVGQVLFTGVNSGFGPGRMHVPMANTALSASATMTPARPAHREPPPTAGRLARQTLLNTLVTTAVAGPMAIRGVSPGNQANGAVTVATVQLGTGVEQTAAVRPHVG
ncbi:hypothetical protein [Streptomyces sp. NPDC021562]|uniref:hypothetical protein n=1 Tax=Streptomyces sp. NPDC021562 TaxID=3155121 RepID=UPI0010501586